MGRGLLAVARLLSLSLSLLFSSGTRALYLVSALSGGGSSSSTSLERLQNDMVITYIIPIHTEQRAAGRGEYS